MVAAIEAARADLRRAQQINAKLDMVYAAEGRLIPPWDRNWWVGPLDAYNRGLKANPDSALLYGMRSQIFAYDGRVAEAVDNARRAVELDPLSTSARDAYISSLAYAGHTLAAKRELEQAERIWPGSSVIEDMRYRFDLRYGDTANALRIMKERGDLIGVTDDPAFEAFMKARISPTAANKDQAVASFLNAYRHDRNHILACFKRLKRSTASIRPMPSFSPIQFCCS